MARKSLSRKLQNSGVLALGIRHWVLVPAMTGRPQASLAAVPEPITWHASNATLLGPSPVSELLYRLEM